jgi:DNA-binding response OmpR family regulator
MTPLITPKLLIVSNSLKTGPLWAYTLQENKFDVILENDPPRALRRWTEESPNLVLFDINDPGSVVLSIIRNLREESNVPVLLLTSIKPEEYILEAYDAGVDECITKPISPSLFHAKIKAWLRRSWSVPMDVLDPLRVGNVYLVPAERKVVIGEGTPIHLTNLEMRLLYIMMNRPSRTVATEDLIQRVWGFSGDADNTVLKNVIYRLRRKIEANQANPVIIHTVAGIGYKFDPAETPTAPAY